ncbi:MAG: universal stress protein [Bordetella sp.]
MHKAVGMAKEMGAKATGFHVVPKFRYVYYNEYIPADFIPLEEQEARSEKVATSYLAEVEKACAAADVKCVMHYVVSDFPAEAIVKAMMTIGATLSPWPLMRVQVSQESC